MDLPLLPPPRSPNDDSASPDEFYGGKSPEQVWRYLEKVISFLETCVNSVPFPEDPKEKDNGSLVIFLEELNDKFKGLVQTLAFIFQFLKRGIVFLQAPTQGSN